MNVGSAKLLHPIDACMAEKKRQQMKKNCQSFPQVTSLTSQRSRFNCFFLKLHLIGFLTWPEQQQRRDSLSIQFRSRAEESGREKKTWKSIHTQLRLAEFNGIHRHDASIHRFINFISHRQAQFDFPLLLSSQSQSCRMRIYMNFSLQCSLKKSQPQNNTRWERSQTAAAHATLNEVDLIQKAEMLRVKKRRLTKCMRIASGNIDMILKQIELNWMLEAHAKTHLFFSEMDTEWEQLWLIGRLIHLRHLTRGTQANQTRDIWWTVIADCRSQRGDHCQKTRSNNFFSHTQKTANLHSSCESHLSLMCAHTLSLFSREHQKNNISSAEKETLTRAIHINYHLHDFSSSSRALASRKIERFLVKTRKRLSFWSHQRKCHNYKDWWLCRL